MPLSTTFLRDFVSNPNELEKLSDWEFLGIEWTGEALEWSQCLVSYSDEKYRSLSLDFNGLEDNTIANILNALQLPLHKGMSLNDVTANYGEALNTASYVEDEVSLEYVIHHPETYYLSLTVSKTVGLKYLVLSNYIPTWMR